MKRNGVRKSNRLGGGPGSVGRETRYPFTLDVKEGGRGGSSLE